MISKAYTKDLMIYRFSYMHFKCSCQHRIKRKYRSYKPSSLKNIMTSGCCGFSFFQLNLSDLNVRFRKLIVVPVVHWYLVSDDSLIVRLPFQWFIPYTPFRLRTKPWIEKEMWNYIQLLKPLYYSWKSALRQLGVFVLLRL